LFVVFMLGIWFAAVYSGHHYIIDVLAGILCALIGIAIFEVGMIQLNKTSWSFKQNKIL